MIQIQDKSRCCGCHACVQRCPKHCITLKEDTEGFLYPVVHQEECIDCGLCDKVCPFQAPNLAKSPLQVFAVKNKQDEQRLCSSSGGLFILLAEHIIQQGGVVFGARFNEKWEVVHSYAETLDELEPMMRSKYVQSAIGNSYKQAEQFLKQGRKVLFAGTSCQIAGLWKFLRKEYQHLITVDFICHGVPSPRIWHQHLSDLVSPCSAKVEDIVGINFREKQLGGFSWKNYGFVLQLKSYSSEMKNVDIAFPYTDSLYMKSFLSNLNLRPSCYHCVCKDGTSGSDMTIADFWGVQQFYPSFDDDKGAGLLFIHSAAAQQLFDLLAPLMDKIKIELSEAIACNPSYSSPVKEPPKRPVFWKTYHQSHSLQKAFNEAQKITYSQKMQEIIQLYHSYFCVAVNKLCRLFS